MTPTPQLDALSVVVQDMAASMAFYRLCGLAVPDDADGLPHVEVSLGDGFRIMFDAQSAVASWDSDWTPPAPGGRLSLAFRCGSPAEVDSVHDALVAAGHAVHLAPFDAFWGQRYASVFDPDDTSVDLYAALPDAHG
jgi:uncharacterized glyoxalase superfamily protein PhnB